MVAVERDQEVFVKFDDAFQVRPNDVLFVCGTIAGLDQYAREFKPGPVENPRSQRTLDATSPRLS